MSVHGNKNFRFTVSLRFRTATVAPQEIYDKLKLRPRIVWVMGEPRMSPKGRILGGTYEVNYCTFKLENHEDEGLSEMIERVVDELVQHKELLQRITNDGGEIEFFIGWFTKGNSGEIFKQSLLQKLGTLGIDLAFDVYNTRRSSS